MRARRRQRFARGDLATAMCPLCGFVVGYRDLTRDWRGKWVCPDCKDRRPYQPPTVPPDVQALHHPQPWLHNYPPPERIEVHVPPNIDEAPDFSTLVAEGLPALLDGGGPATGGDMILDGGPPVTGGDVILDGGGI